MISNFLGDADCENGEDEPEDCKDDSVKKCDESYYKCNNHRCIPGRWKCDHDDDCGDNSDEKDCPGEINMSKFEFHLISLRSYIRRPSTFKA